MKCLKPIQTIQFWLLGIAAGLISLHLHLAWRSDNNDLFSSSLLFWVAILFSLGKKGDRLNLQSGVFASFFGASLIAWLLFKSLYLVGDDFFGRLSPFISVFSLSLLASGFKGLKQYTEELLLASFIAIPWEKLLYLFIDLSVLTAQFSSFFLWLLGFEVKRQGVIVILPTGSIEVYNGCAGLKLMLQLLGLVLIFLVMVPTSRKAKILLPLAAILLGFVINGMRVALMAVLVALSDQDAFKYWHLGEGSLIFSAIAVLILGICGAGFIQSPAQPPKSKI
ncbi:MAG TPA: cyanoexosortase A [Cyanobacteria bacterium UBA8803]|nr:cyanoexosortase A [Cyanobacteria bacterium UBA9273]HBL60536.1 cyanoexosortase A [Cyanobacteria bacterium UBA8803]